MFGLITETTHKRRIEEAVKATVNRTIERVAGEIDGLQRQVDSYADRNASLQAEIERLRPMADKWQAHLDRAQANFRKGK